MHTDIGVHFKDLVIEVDLNRLLFEFLFERKVFDALWGAGVEEGGFGVRVRVDRAVHRLLISTIFVHVAFCPHIIKRHILILLIQGLPHIGKQWLFFKDIIMKMHRIHFQIPKLILDR